MPPLTGPWPNRLISEERSQMGSTLTSVEHSFTSLGLKIFKIVSQIPNIDYLAISYKIIDIIYDKTKV